MSAATRRRRAPLPRVSRLAGNVRATYDRATSDDVRQGTEWYAAAHTLAAELADTYGVPIETSAAVIAVLSPQVSWTRNVVMAREVFATGSTRGLGVNVHKAERLLAGEAPADVVGGLKVTSFWRNILAPTHPEYVTVDRHAFDIAQGKRTGDKARAVLANRSHYDRYVAAYKVTAGELGIGAAELQAIVWCAWRREHGITA